VTNLVKNPVRDIEFRKPCQNVTSLQLYGLLTMVIEIKKACILAAYECGKDNKRLEKETI
jgi:hypothetical protein